MPIDPKKDEFDIVATRGAAWSRNEIAAFAVYLILLSVVTWGHTLWRDVSEVWLVARASPNLISLLHNTRYEGHPPLWYLVVYGITRFTSNPDWIKLPNLICALASAALILLRTRLRMPIRVGMVFSYYMVFEYGVIARNYMLGVVLLLAAVTAMRRQDRPSAIAPMWLSLAALTSLPALIVAMCLGAVWLYLAIEGSNDWSMGGVSRRLGWRRIAAAAVFGLSMAIAVFMIRPPADSGLLMESASPHFNLFQNFFRMGFVIASGYFPIPTFRHAFWGATVAWAFPVTLVASILGWIVVVGLALFLRSVPIRCFFVGTTALLIAELMISGRMGARHIGWMFVVLMCAMLLDHAGANDVEASRPGRRGWLCWGTVAVVFGCQLVAAGFATAVSLRYPFSSSREVADYLRTEHLGRANLVFQPFFVGESVLAYLQQPSAYDLTLGRQETFVIWNQEEYLSRLTDPDPEAFRALGRHGDPPVLITEDPLTPAEMAKFNVRQLASFTDAICTLDRYFIYR